MSGDAAPATPRETGPESGSEAPSGSSAGDQTLFARKGNATPAPVKGDRPAIFLVGETLPDQFADEPDSEKDDASADDIPGDALYELEDDGTDIAKGDDIRVLTPAASLDTEAFDPARARPLQLDDAGDAEDANAAEDDGDAAPADVALPPAVATGGGRRRLLSTLLVGAAAAAAIAAVVTALNWYEVSHRFAPETNVPMTPPQDTGPVPAAAPAAAEPGAGAPAVPPPEAAAAPPAAIAAPAPPAPSIDLVRVEPGGGTVIAGHAAPGTALIVLDNDTPIGSVVAGAEGDWMLIPDAPLAGGDHEIALAVKAGDGAVSIAAPSPDATDATPTPRPATGDMASDAPSYVVQVASVKTADGAAREWAKLARALPDLLGDMTPTIDTAELHDRGTFHRIRLGPFADRQTAHDLCTALTKAGRDCLVVRR